MENYLCCVHFIPVGAPGVAEVKRLLQYTYIYETRPLVSDSCHSLPPHLAELGQCIFCLLLCVLATPVLLSLCLQVERWMMKHPCGAINWQNTRYASFCMQPVLQCITSLKSIFHFSQSFIIHVSPISKFGQTVLFFLFDTLFCVQEVCIPGILWEAPL